MSFGGSYLPPSKRCSPRSRQSNALSSRSGPGPSIDGARDVTRLDPRPLSNRELRVVPRVEVRNLDLRMVAQNAHDGVCSASTPLGVVRTSTIATMLADEVST